MRARVTAAVALVSFSACTLLTDLDGLSLGSSAAPDGGDAGPALDAAVADGRLPEVEPRDADVAADASNERDARSDGGPCSEELLVGNRTVDGSTVDHVGEVYLDTYGYNVTKAGTATCVWVYIDADWDHRVVVGVYGDASGNPSNLLAEASLTTAVKGWNAIPLSKPVLVESSKAYWIGVNSPDAPLPNRVRHPVTCPPFHLRVGAATGNERAPSPYPPGAAPTLDFCDMVAYLAASN